MKRSVSESKMYTLKTIPLVSSQIQQLPDIITDGGVVTRAMRKSINTCQKIQQIILSCNNCRYILEINKYYSHFLFSVYEKKLIGMVPQEPVI